jgi:hypothetical protein
VKRDGGDEDVVMSEEVKMIDQEENSFVEDAFQMATIKGCESLFILVHNPQSRVGPRGKDFHSPFAEVTSSNDNGGIIGKGVVDLSGKLRFTALSAFLRHFDGSPRLGCGWSMLEQAISRVLFPPYETEDNDHSSSPGVTTGLKRPTRELGRTTL